MDIKLEHVSIIDKNSQLVCLSRNGNIQLFFGIVTFGSPCMSFTHLFEEIQDEHKRWLLCPVVVMIDAFLYLCFVSNHLLLSSFIRMTLFVFVCIFYNYGMYVVLYIGDVWKSLEWKNISVMCQCNCIKSERKRWILSSSCVTNEILMTQVFFYLKRSMH
jgi:hypothetical protein